MQQAILCVLIGFSRCRYGRFRTIPVGSAAGDADPVVWRIRRDSDGVRPELPLRLQRDVLSDLNALPRLIYFFTKFPSGKVMVLGNSVVIAAPVVCSNILRN